MSPPDPRALELSDFDVEHDALDAAGGLRALAAFLRALDCLKAYSRSRDWTVDADQLEALADTLAHDIAPLALSRQRPDTGLV